MSHACRAIAADHAIATPVMPGGGTRGYHFDPSLRIVSGDGPFVVASDGRRLLDCTLCFGTLMLGHAHPKVVAAVQEAATSGLAFGAPCDLEPQLAARIAERVPGIDRVAFVASGTEATMAAVRLARAATGRRLIAKAEGGWHGWHDGLLYSFLAVDGPVEAPIPVPVGAGIGPASETVVFPYNHPAALDLVDAWGPDLAAVIVEPLQGAGGGIVGDANWLRSLRERTAATGALFIADEVITGFRCGAGGLSTRYALQPDLVTFGKAVGGGLPIGVLAGSAEAFAPLNGPSGTGPAMFGTFAGHPLAMAAGAAQLDVLADPSIYDQLARAGDIMRGGLHGIAAEFGIPLTVTGTDSLWGLHLLGEAPSSVRDITGRPELRAAATELARLLRNENLLVHSPVHLEFLSTTHDANHIETALTAHRRALRQLRDDNHVKA